MIEVSELRKVIKGKLILDIPSLSFEEGKFCGLIGKNGSGKSTLLRIILDMDRPTSGRVFISGKDNSSTESWKIKTGAYLDEDFLIDFLTPEEYFELLFKLRRKDRKAYTDFTVMMEKFFDNEILGQVKPISAFSKGNRQKIGISGAMIGDIGTLILDEPFSHIDKGSEAELREILNYLNTKKGVTIILTAHDASWVEDLFDATVTLQDGRVISQCVRAGGVV